ncbi:ABC transporter ATP-binding protein [Kineococcus terrestris]|uniref:ABC transporter ATP-binding protein n=1 Tax=Kineococcus terrestris TaxID=2044856 RepID=UPI003F68AC2F
MDTAVEVEQLAVRLGGRPGRRGRPVLDGLSFTVPAGSVTGLLGPSGSGKTTLLRCLVGVQRTERGRVRVLGLPAGAAALRRRTGYVTQTPSVYGDLTVAENVRYFAALHGAGRAAADEALAAVGLAGAAGQLTATLSGGQRGRVSLACALVGRPELLVLDEPTVGLDPLLRVELWERFRALAREGTTVLVSSHVMDEAARCDRLLLLRGGRLLADCTADRLRRDTGAEDLEEAFLRLVRAGGGAGREVAA